MKPNIAFASIIAVVIVVYYSVFTVHMKQSAILLQLGKPVSAAPADLHNGSWQLVAELLVDALPAPEAARVLPGLDHAGDTERKLITQHLHVGLTQLFGGRIGNEPPDHALTFADHAVERAQALAHVVRIDPVTEVNDVGRRDPHGLGPAAA